MEHDNTNNSEKQEQLMVSCTCPVCGTTMNIRLSGIPENTVYEVTCNCGTKLKRKRRLD